MIETVEAFRAHLLEERRRAKEAAQAFIRVCADDDADKLYSASLWLDEKGDEAWRFAMQGVVKLKRVSAEIRQAFIPIWVEHKMLPLTVGSRPLLTKALRVLLPGGYTGSRLTVYRGASNHERRRRLYGFSWTTEVAVARKFAEHWAKPMPASYTGPTSQGVILQTTVPCGAIFLIRKPEDYYDEGEVVVDPFRLGRVRLLERLTADTTNECT
jgi:hypothetical protein